MGNEKALQLLQRSFIGVLADAVYQFGEEGVIDKVTERKKKDQMINGKRNAGFYGVSAPEEVFTIFCAIFDNTKWSIDQKANGFSAETSTCKLCSMAKKLGSPSPCKIYCLNPLEGLIKGLDNALAFNVKETLWHDKKCRIEVVK